MRAGGAAVDFVPAGADSRGAAVTGTNSGFHGPRREEDFDIFRNRTGGRGGSFSGFRPASVLAQTPGKRRRSSTAAASSRTRCEFVVKMSCR